MPDESPPSQRNALLVTDRFFMRSYDGSTLIYAAWLSTLKRLGFRVAVVSVNWARMRWTEADLARLADETDDVLILDAFSSTTAAALNKAERIAWRLLAGRRHPRCLSGRRHAALNAERLARFLAERAFDVVVVNKTLSLRVLGRELDRVAACKILDIHDNMVRRVQLSRSVALRLIPSYPWLARLFRPEEISDMISWGNEGRLMREEVRQLGGFNAVLFAAEEEARAFVSAGLDPSLVCAIPWPMIETPQVPDHTDEFHIGFLGSNGFFNFEAVEFLAQHVLPRLRRAHPQLRVLIAGGTAHSARKIRQMGGAELVPWVEHVADFYRRVQVVVVPLLSGTGVSVKTLEAAAYGSAIVATPVGLRGLALRHEQDVLVAEGGENFAAAVSRLLHDPPLRARLGASAATAITAHHSLEAFSRAIGALVPPGTLPHGGSRCR